MDENWEIETFDVRGGFLDGLKLRLPRGLTCIIGPRGSGKSTLAEAIRWAVCGVEGASKGRVDLFRANLQKATVSIKTGLNVEGQGYAIRREVRQPPLLTTLAGRTVLSVDLDRGTFLPMDAYSSHEIEAIADQTLGPRRRALLDELSAIYLGELQDQLAEARRALMANADSIRAKARLAIDLTEQIQALGDVRGQLESLPALQAEDPSSLPLRAAARQRQLNSAEQTSLTALNQAIETFSQRLQQTELAAREQLTHRMALADSDNERILAQADEVAQELSASIASCLTALLSASTEATSRLALIADELTQAQTQQDIKFAQLEELNVAASAAARTRAAAEQAVERLLRMEKQREVAGHERERLEAERRTLRTHHSDVRDKISAVREQIAIDIMHNAGDHVRLRVRHHADNLDYQQTLARALHGAGVKGHDAIIESLVRLRPDELAHLIATRNVSELEVVCRLGLERSRRVMDSFVQLLDPLDLEVLTLDDLIAIELNVGTVSDPLYKDAADLSQGQKCTALLPLLLSRRRSPLLVDQPEDNLDNQFIFRTVVESVRRLHAVRQMIFITHNANIPVLGAADLVVVMGSDGRSGFIQKQGTVDECQQEIVDLLEGGREAFELRRQRYARR